MLDPVWGVGRLRRGRWRRQQPSSPDRGWHGLRPGLGAQLLRLNNGSGATTITVYGAFSPGGTLATGDSYALPVGTTSACRSSERSEIVGGYTGQMVVEAEGVSTVGTCKFMAFSAGADGSIVRSPLTICHERTAEGLANGVIGRRDLAA